MRAAGYVRVSSGQQVENGYGLEVQREGIAAYCKRKGRRVSRWFEDAGVSGSLLDRPALGEVQRAIEQGEIDTVVVHRLDRLARDLIVQETILAAWQKAGAQVFSVEEADLGGEDPSRVLIRQIMGAINQYAKAMIVLRLRAGKERKHREGGFVGGGVPFGYRDNAKRLEVDPEEVKAIRRMRQLRKQGKSYWAIAKQLEAEGYPTKRGGRWDMKTVYRVLRSPVLRGKAKWQGRLVAGKHEAIIGARAGSS